MRPSSMTLGDSRRPGVQGSFLRAIRIIHPFPTLLNVAATAGLAVVAWGGVPPGGLLARMLVVMLCAQSAIGIVNDCFDRELDAANKPWKPIVAGAVSPAAAVAAAAAFVATTIGVAASLGRGSLGLAALGLACGLLYDARLKRTVWSAVPYMIAIPTLPLWVWVTLDEWRPVLMWLLPLGMLIGLALHLANTVPDLDADRAQGIEGMAHRLGAGRSMALAWASYALALGLSLALAPIVRYDFLIFAPAFAAGSGLLLVSVGAYAIRRDDVSLQFGFGALGIGAAVLAAGWLGAVT